MAALGAYAVGHAGLTAIRTKRGLRRAQRIMRAALVSTCFRMSSLWIWHNYSVFGLSVLETLKRGPARIDFVVGAVALPGIQICSALRAHSFAILAAKRARRHGQ